MFDLFCLQHFALNLVGCLYPKEIGVKLQISHKRNINIVVKNLIL